ncbi:RBBP8 N-terminal-like protein isoform X2 [Elephas maximus indicus]|uniref:RBBP8 N-terminal-like protein isoform X2 n=1 Tax=Elephas maximus indicus TaxID=99487 RepID=UPI002116242F|nr:RBBP8 N-terminal-like protein isoform X2 [Elephas maximus indicus]
METFVESLNRLKDIHEKEVLGLQNKLLELNSERCRDAQRMEELFAKNHQLREQQKALTENVRVLENRLRAGLCDRCMVTQELARKKQQEFESAHLQSLQHIFLLTNEMTRLKEENRSLKEEVKRLRGLEDRPKPLSREGATDPPSPLLLPSPGGQKAGTEKSPQGHEEPEAECPSIDPRGEEQPLGYRTSSATKISPGANLPGPRAPDMSPQRISNQLHGTIAVVRPGSQVCLVDHSSSNGTPPPPTRSSPPSPNYEPSLPLDSLLRASRPSTMAFEALKRSLQADRLGLLSRHLALRIHSPRSSSLNPTMAPDGPRPKTLKAVETESWEGPTGLLGLPGTLADVRDPRLEGTLHLLLTQRRLRVRAGSARPKGLPVPGGMPPSPPTGPDSEGPEDIKVARAGLTTAAWHEGWHPQPTDGGSPRGEMVAALQEYAPDKPLDLSDRGRGRNAPKPACHPGSLSPPTTHTPSPESPQGAEPPAQSRPLIPSPQAISNRTKGARAPETEEPPTPLTPPQPLPEHRLRLPSSGGMVNEPRGRPRQPTHPERPDTDGHTESSKAKAQRPESDGLDEPDTSDSEAPSSEADAKPSTPREGPRCSCDKELQHGLQRKRKRASAPRGKASRKSSRGRWKPPEPLAVGGGPGSPQDTEDSSPSPSSRDWEET